MAGGDGEHAGLERARLRNLAAAGQGRREARPPVGLEEHAVAAPGCQGEATIKLGQGERVPIEGDAAGIDGKVEGLACYRLPRGAARREPCRNKDGGEEESPDEQLRPHACT